MKVQKFLLHLGITTALPISRKHTEITKGIAGETPGGCFWNCRHGLAHEEIDADQYLDVQFPCTEASLLL